MKLKCTLALLLKCFCCPLKLTSVAQLSFENTGRGSRCAENCGLTCRFAEIGTYNAGTKFVTLHTICRNCCRKICLKLLFSIILAAFCFSSWNLLCSHKRGEFLLLGKLFERKIEKSLLFLNISVKKMNKELA